MGCLRRVGGHRPLGRYCVIMVWRRVAQTRFLDEKEQDEFLGELENALVAESYETAIGMCEGDRRAAAIGTLFHRSPGFRLSEIATPSSRTISAGCYGRHRASIELGGDCD